MHGLDVARRRGEEHFRRRLQRGERDVGLHDVAPLDDERAGDTCEAAGYERGRHEPAIDFEDDVRSCPFAQPARRV